MSEVLANFVNSAISAALGFYIIKVLTKSEKKLLNIHTIKWLIVEIVIVTVLQGKCYVEIKPLIIYCVNILIYKKIFSFYINESIIIVGLAMLLNLLGDMLISIVITLSLPFVAIRGNLIMGVIINLIIAIITLTITRNHTVKTKLQSFCNNIKNKRIISNTIFFSLTIIISCILGFELYKNTSFDYTYITTIIVVLILVTLIVIFINNRDEYNKLTIEYDNLFNYIQIFEEWIEKEQLNRHEYKNQLAVLRCLTKEKKVKEKIDEILEDNINLEGHVIQQLKGLPKGGIKGLMYYKSAIAQKYKIDLTVDVSLERKTLLNILSEKDVRVLCKLIGIYFDNAIEAARETRKKKILIEIYELNDKIVIIFSNTFKPTKIVEERNKKGISSKGEGRGNGLYFASKLIKENEWLIQKQEIIDKYYIQELSIRPKKES